MPALKSIKRALLLAGAGFLLSQSAAFAQSARGDASKGKAQPKTATVSTAQFIYQALLGEIAAHRGATSAAVASYLDLTRKTRDPRIARRATEIALQNREIVLATEAARLWLDIEPESQTALQTLTAITAESLQKPEELEASLKTQLEKQAPKRAAILLQLPQLLSRYPDTKVSRQIINRLSEPYLKLPEAHYVRGIAAALVQDATTGISEANAALALRPDWEEAAMLRWRISSPQQRQESAEALRAFGEKYPSAANARLTYIHWLTSEKHTDEAIKAAQRLLKDIPDNDDLRYATAMVLAEAGDLSSAETLLRQLLDRSYRDTDLLKLQLGQLTEEQNRLEESLALYANVSPGRHYAAAIDRQARLLFKQGQLREAQHLLQRAASVQPEDSVRLQLTEADILRQANKPDESFGTLELVLALEPDNPEALYMSALLAEPLKKYDIMEQRLQRVIKLKPDYAQAYNALGYSYADRNIKLEEAASLLEKALKLDPDDAAILDSVAWLRFRQGNFASAKELIQRAMQLMDDPEVQAHYVEILWTAGQKNEARAAFEAAQKATPDSLILENLKKKLGL